MPTELDLLLQSFADTIAANLLMLQGIAKRPGGGPIPAELVSSLDEALAVLMAEADRLRTALQAARGSL